MKPNAIAFRLLKEVEGSRSAPINPNTCREAIGEIIRLEETAPAWQPIETAPLGDDDFYLVCCNDPADDRSPFVVRGSIFASARKHPVQHHLSLAYLTHWMPLPAKPTLCSTDGTKS